MTKKIILNQIIITFFVFILSQLVLAGIINYLNWNYYTPENWLRWDSGHYLQIAKSGYEFFPCAGKFGYPENAIEMCGNTGWYPGYPLLIKLFSYIYANDIIVAGVLSKIFFVLSLFLVLKISNINSISFRNIIYLCIPAFSFSFIYYHAIFPISSLVFFALAALYLYLEKKIWLTGLFCFFAVVFYPTGFLLPIVFGIVILLHAHDNYKRKIIEFIIPASFGMLGLLLVFATFQYTVNDWEAFIKVQAKYGHDFQNPFLSVYNYFIQHIGLNQYNIKNFIQYQSLTIIVSYILLTFFFIYYKMYRNNLYIWTYVYVTLYFLFPWSVGGDLSRYRAESLLFPFVFILKETKTQWLVAILIGLLCLGIPMSYLFFDGTLI